MADIQETNFDRANFERANLEIAQCLSFYQLTKVKTLYVTKFDEEYSTPLKKKHPILFEKSGK